jgi:hypothetical protein
MMRLRDPIFVIGFQRGGTNILTNLVASHPQIRMLGRETHQVFYGKAREPLAKWKRRLLYSPILLGARGHLFRATHLQDRNRVPRVLLPYIDWLLFREAGRPEPTIRVLCKNVNGMALVTQVFQEMYPGATFFALVRNGLALCEGHIRRGRRAEEFARLYNRVCQRMLQDAAAMPNYHLVKFEEMVEDPVALAAQAYREVGLDATPVTRYRLQAKQSMDPEGKRSYTFGGQRDRETQWFEPADLSGCFRKDVNANQIARLAPRDRATFLQVAGRTMEQLGYA